MRDKISIKYYLKISKIVHCKKSILQKWIQSLQRNKHKMK